MNLTVEQELAVRIGQAVAVTVGGTFAGYFLMTFPDTRQATRCAGRP